MENRNVTPQDLLDLLKHFEDHACEATTCEPDSVQEKAIDKCEYLFRRDYSIIELDNKGGQLSSRYPGRIFIPESEHSHMAATITASTVNILSSSSGSTSGFESGNSRSAGNGNSNNTVTFAYGSMPPQPQTQQQQRTIYENFYDVGRIRELITVAKYARCRQRFVVPVIMYRGKYICRSATISVPQETYGRKVVARAFDYLHGTNYGERIAENENNDPTEESLVSSNTDSIFNYEEVIKADVQLLNALNISTIVDLMVEMRKIKYFVTVSSSEKADMDKRYASFNILSLPYPGCEFFQKFRDNNYVAKNLQYDWSLPFNDAEISVPKNGPAAELDIQWANYKGWDAVLLIQNYLKAMLKYIQEDNGGLLIHCISGWDRTPLFISLVRLSLWADGLIHQSLDALQITYLTVAYDWYLFGHQLPDRMKRSEEIMFFCFHVLKFIMGDEFSIVEHRKRAKTPSSGSSVSVIKQDDDSQVKEDLLFSLDESSNGSFSNVSNCDIEMREEFFALTSNSLTAAPTSPTTTAAIALTSRSPNSKRVRTNPISVPGASATRQRHESTSSNSSWHMVTETGSIDSTGNDSFMRNNCSDHSSNGSDQSSSDIQLGNASSNTSDGASGNVSSYSDGSSNGNTGSSSDAPTTQSEHNSTTEQAQTTNNKKPPPTIRAQRLIAVRKHFVKSYSSTIGLQFQGGTTLASFLNVF